MEKYGFVYIWYDVKRKMYYVGCHWGHEDDGYICSSKWMRDAYRYRSKDFKRRIIGRVYSSREDLLVEEYRFLSMINNEELGKKYYNLRNHHFNHWLTIEQEAVSIKKKISNSVKKLHKDPVYRARYEQMLTTRDCRSSDPEVREKRRQSMIVVMAKKFPVEERIRRVTAGTPERTEQLRQQSLNMWAARSPEERAAIIEKGTAKTRGVKMPKFPCPHCGKIASKAMLARHHLDNCKQRGLVT